jgi:hypothetical protein
VHDRDIGHSVADVLPENYGPLAWNVSGATGAQHHAIVWADAPEAELMNF